MSQFNDGMFRDSNLKIRNVTQAQFNAQKVNFNPDVIYRVDGVLHLPDENTETYASAVTTIRDANGNVVGLGVGGQSIIRAYNGDGRGLKRKSFNEVVPVMASPPTIAQATASTSTIASALLWPAVVSSALNPVFSYTGIGPLPWQNDASYIVPKSAVATEIAQQSTYRFWTDALTLELRLINFTGRFQIYIDGQSVQAATFTTAGAGAGEILKLTFATAEPRFIEITGYNFPFGGCWTEPSARVWAAEQTLPLMFIVGDSYSLSAGHNWLDYCARMMGYDYAADGVGGSGYMTASPADPTSRLNVRLANLSRKPDVIVFALGYNDSASPQVSIGANATSAINAAKALCPQATIVVLGPWTPQGDTTNLTNTAVTLEAAANAAGVLYCSIRGMISMANEAKYIGADNVHPLDSASHAYHAHVIAGLLMRLGL